MKPHLEQMRLPHQWGGVGICRSTVSMVEWVYFVYLTSPQHYLLLASGLRRSNSALCSSVLAVRGESCQTPPPRGPASSVATACCLDSCSAFADASSTPAALSMRFSHRRWPSWPPGYRLFSRHLIRARRHFFRRHHLFRFRFGYNSLPFGHLGLCCGEWFRDLLCLFAGQLSGLHRDRELIVVGVRYPTTKPSPVSPSYWQLLELRPSLFEGLNDQLDWINKRLHEHVWKN